MEKNETRSKNPRNLQNQAANQHEQNIKVEKGKENHQKTQKSRSL